MGNTSSGREREYESYSTGSAVDPYKVFNLPRDFTWDQLKDAYRRLSMKVHPDKGGSPELFNVVTDCFRTLAYDFKARQSDKPHHELKRAAQDYYRESPFSPMATQPEVPAPEPEHIPRGVAGGNFNDKFNRLFEDARLEDDEVATGYGHMMETSTAERDDLKIHKKLGGITNDKFNELFDKRVVPKTKEVIVYKEPEALVMAKNLQFSELGADKPGDYTKSERDGGGLGYTDYKVAYTTTRLYDPRAVTARKEYKSVDDYEADRARTFARGATKEELQYQALKKAAEDKAEEERLRRLASRDAVITKHSERVNQRAIGLR